ncbi:condensation domain-containing protein [Streptomyces sp. S.PNR 29]|uniref:condensation domain-containing protein n=1 Tax=Streptomyces sp. S.PNR 29 TaxID=2973805 RepID=UPI0025B1EBB8|nr:condensation domain-containing protein [Streptomyces sp. S.PNR 29]MDN0201122.1 condensation domain-containing protein [Streptomyces sp. S.PNR 29]
MQSDVEIKFSGSRSGEGPLTWGQRAMVEAMARNRQTWNIACALDLTHRHLDASTVLASLGTVIARNESLRTLVRVVDGEPRQCVVDSGTLPVTTVLCSAAEARDHAERLIDERNRRPFRLDAEWPVRITLVIAEDRVRYVVFVFSHVAVDNMGMLLAREDLSHVLTTGSPAWEPGLQPLDIARHESTKGRSITDRAVRYWTEQLRRIPPTTLTPVGPAHEPRIQQATLTSSAVRAAVERLAARHRTTSTTLLMSAAAMVLGAWTGHPAVAMNVQVGNRFKSAYRRTVGNLVQLGLFVLDLPPKSRFNDIVPAAKASALLTYRYGYYELAALDRARSRVNAERGAVINPLCCFNAIDARLDDGDVSGEVPDHLIRARLTESELTWDDDPHQARCHFCLRTVDPNGEVHRLSLAADTRYLPPDRIEAFLREMEHVLVEAAVTGR